jgi:hypothetical protein
MLNANIQFYTSKRVRTRVRANSTAMLCQHQTHTGSRLALLRKSPTTADHRFLGSARAAVNDRIQSTHALRVRATAFTGQQGSIQSP